MRATAVLVLAVLAATSPVVLQPGAPERPAGVDVTACGFCWDGGIGAPRPSA